MFPLTALILPALLCGQTVITLKTDSVRYVMTDGIGGNFCFGFDRPTTQHALDNMKVANARTEFPPKLWEPENDNSDPNSANTAFFQAKDTGMVKKRFELMQEFTRRKIPYMVSSWRIPDWMGEVVRVDNGQTTHRIPAAKLPEVVESIVTFLTYARDHYQTEPEYFSFNESDGGYYVLFTGQEHANFIKALGPRLVAAGLKTKLSLGDVHVPWAIGFTNEAAKDPEALKYIGLVSFHSWHTGSPAQLEAWSALARRLKVPLWDTESGVDGEAHRTPERIRTFEYGLVELNQYFEILTHARPQAIQFWQYSEGAGLGYSLLTADMKPTERYAYMMQWADYIPPGSEALTAVKADGVQFLSFRHPQNQTMALFFFNNSAVAKKLTVQGLPASLATLDAVHTLKGTLSKKFPGPTPKSGAITLDIPPYSFTTLHGSYRVVTTLNSQSINKGSVDKGPYIFATGASIFDVRGKRMLPQVSESGPMLPRVEAGPSEGADR